MPYKLSEDGLCVMKDTGETVKCHPTHAEALAHMQALMVNVPEAKAMSTQDMHDLAAEQHATAVQNGADCSCNVSTKDAPPGHEFYGNQFSGGGGGGGGSSGSGGDGGGGGSSSSGSRDNRRGAGTPAREQFDFLNRRLAAGHLKKGERASLEARVEKLAKEIMGVSDQGANKAGGMPMTGRLMTQDMHDEAAMQHDMAVMGGAQCDCPMKSAKAGARHSGSDLTKGRGVKQKAREIVQDMEDLGFPDLQNVGAPGEVPAAKGDELPATGAAPVIFGAVKAAGDWELDVLYMPYGGQKNGKDAQGEYFSAKTNDHADKFPNPVILYYHGYTPDGQPQGSPDIIGQVLKRWADGAGRWVRVKLDQANQYARRVWDSAQKGRARASSGSIAHLVRKEADGHLTNWPTVEISLFDTEGKRQPANAYAVAMPAAKAHLRLGGINLPTEFNDDSQAKGAGSAAESKTTTTKGILDMDEQELIALLDKRDAEKAAREKAVAEAEAARQAKEQERIEAAVKAEREKNEKEIAKIKAQYVAGGRLPMGDPNGAPHQARFADTRKYDGMGPADLAFTIALLGAHKAAVSETAYKALAIKVAEDKTEVTGMGGVKADLGEQGRIGLKALGFEPEHFLDAAKANEVNYSTLANYGDEWVGIEYSRRLWPAVRAATFVLDKLPQVEVPQGVESIIIPLESTDPIFYKVAQTTDENATTLTPNASVPSSRLGTARNTLTVAKGGARTQYSGEMEEDSLIPWASQLRTQLELATAERLEHAVIDGDTDTTNSTNINTIASTPAGTEFYLLVDGFRKSALVTTTANSRSASGTLVDTDFMDTAWLMGAAGKIGGDPTKVDFIIDPNVSKKAAYLASLKTKDVFTAATLENGLVKGIWAYRVYTSWFMHFVSTTNPLKANTAGKVNLANQALNTTGAILAVRWDQWTFGWKRRVRIETVRIPRSDITEITATLRFGLLQRDTEGSAISYNVGV